MISPGLERPLLRVRRRPAAALDRRLADPVLEAEGRPPGRQLVAVLAPDQLDAGELLRGRGAPARRTASSRAASGESAARATWTSRRAERLLPVLGAALADVAQLGGAGGHALPELRREAVERGLRHPERLQALVGEGDGDPGVAGRIGRRPSRVDERRAAAGPARARRRGRRCAAAGRCRRRATGRSCSAPLWMSSSSRPMPSRRGHGCVPAIAQWCSGGSGGSGFGAAR